MNSQGRFTFLFALALAAPTALASDRHRYTGEGETFDFAIEAGEGTATLYVARKPSNERHAGDTPRLVPDDEKLASIPFEPTAEAGVYVAKIAGELPEGQVEVTIGGVKEAADAYAVEGAHDDHADHEGHAHGAARKSPAEIARSLPVIGTGLLGMLLIGFILGKLGRKREQTTLTATTKEVSAAGESLGESIKRSSAILATVLAAGSALPKDARADEGHTHDTIGISTGATAAGEVSITKKSQFLIDLRTTSAASKPVQDTLETFGHLTAKPQLDAKVTAPVSGFVKLASDKLLGSRVKKGQVLGRIEGVAAVDFVAPISGTVLDVHVVDGTRLDAGEPLVRVVDQSTLWIDAEVFQKDLAKIRSAKTASIIVEGSTATFAGRILGIKSTIDEHTLTAKVYVEIDNPDGALPLGALANVSFSLPTQGMQGMAFPRGTVLNRGGETIVFVQTGPESFVAKPVATRFGSEPATVIVTKGLEEGDRVVVTGGYQLLVGAN